MWIIALLYTVKTSFPVCSWDINHKYTLHNLMFQGNVSFSCSEPVLVSSTFLSSSSSFLALPLDSAAEMLSVSLQFRTWNREGMLLSAGLGEGSEKLLLLLVHGQLRLSHHRSALQSSDIVIGETFTAVLVCVCGA